MNWQIALLMPLCFFSNLIMSFLLNPTNSLLVSVEPSYIFLNLPLASRPLCQHRCPPGLPGNLTPRGRPEGFYASLQ